MNELAPKLRNAGIGLLVAALNGTGFQFTKIVIGNGKIDEDDKNTNFLGNPLVEIGLTKIEKHNNFVVLTGTYDNSNVADGFYMNEIGVYAQQKEGEEVLYAYRFADTNVEYVPAKDSGNVVETEISVIVSVGDAANVSAVLIEASAYVSKEVFEQHVSGQDNPHGITKEMVGLGNVQNVDTNSQIVTYTVAKTLSNLTSGEIMQIAFAKIAKAISSLISHLNAKNPHKITPEAIGAALSSHSHSAGNITSGTLSVLRGGTGQTSVASILKAWKLTNAAIDAVNIGAQNGYIKFSNGFLVQWEKTSVSAEKNDIGMVSALWAQDFNAAPAAFCTCGTAKPDIRYATLYNVTAKGYEAYLQNAGNSTTNSIYVLALGKWK